MLQRSLPSATSTELAESLQRTFGRGWLRPLQKTLQLPTSWQEFMLLLAIVLVVGAGLALHILLSVQIAEAEFEVRSLRAEYERIERQNSDLIYQIATRSSLATIQDQAAQEGFVPATGRTYVFRNQLAGMSVPGLASESQTASLPAQNSPTESGVQPGRANAPSQPVDWQQSQQWWQATQESAQTAVDQFLRDVMGRVR